MGSENYDDTKKFEEVSLKETIIKIQELWYYLLSRWLIILIFGILGGILGFTYAFLKKPTYTSKTIFVLEDEKSAGGLGGLAGLASMAGVDVSGGGGIFQGDNILQLYKSRTMLERTLLTEFENNGKMELLIDRYIDFNKLREKWSEEAELKNITFTGKSFKKQSGSSKFSKQIRLRDSILGLIVADLNDNYLTVSKPDKKFSTIQVGVKASNEIFAKVFNDALVKNVNEFYINTKTKKSLQNVNILQHKTDSVWAVMNGAIYTAVAVSDATPNLNPTRQVQRVAPAQRAQFSAETNKAILAEIVKNLEMSKMSLLKETPLIQVIDQPVYPLQKERLGKAKGTAIGGILAGSLIVAILLSKRFLKDLMS